tara:strand:- start:84 stop:383 length:300 start_codon:yes stop_codon:yes gene_type:complete
LYVKKILKNEINIRNEKIITCKSFVKIDERSLTGKKPPDEISVIAKFNELNDLIPKKFKTKKIEIVNPEYNKKIFIVCFNISVVSKEKKFVNDFFKLSS